MTALATLIVWVLVLAVFRHYRAEAVKRWSSSQLQSKNSAASGSQPLLP